MTKPDRIMVLFTRNCSPYRAGERAAFNKPDAQKLVDRKLAVFDEPKTSEEAKVDEIEEEIKDHGDTKQDDDDEPVTDTPTGDDDGNGEEEGAEEAKSEKPKRKRTGKSKGKRKTRTKL